MMQRDFRNLPSVDRLLSHERLRALAQTYSREAVVALVRGQLEEARQAIGAGGPAPDLERLVAEAVARAQAWWEPSLRPVINATGVILHTNLGRAPLSPEAMAAMEQVARGYSNLEFDLERGERGSRFSHLERLLCQVTGAEAALAVNNNASAVLLALTALAQGNEVIVSRGQAVEIGGGFRIPDVLRQSGARLVEVGTTNRTYLRDYEDALTGETAALLRVHTSNFRVVGFTHSVDLPELVELAHSWGLLVLDDLGSGCLLDTTQFGLAKEPLVQESVAAGTDLTFFSGDKLLGGPQAGIIAGKRALVERLQRHPLARAVRPDKVTIAALAATLLHYVKGEALEKVPVWRMIAAPLSELEGRAQGWARILGEAAQLREGQSMIGGGSLPGEALPTRLLSIAPPLGKGQGPGAAAETLAARLRRGKPAVVGRVEQDRLLLDLRTVLPQEDDALLLAVSRAMEEQRASDLS